MKAVAIITGAGSGIGRALAQELDACGYAVIGIGRRRDQLEATGATCSNFTTLVSDVGDPSARQALATELQGQRLALLIHNAGRLDPVADLRASATTIGGRPWR